MSTPSLSSGPHLWSSHERGQLSDSKSRDDLGHPRSLEKQDRQFGKSCLAFPALSWHLFTFNFLYQFQVQQGSISRLRHSADSGDVEGLDLPRKDADLKAAAVSWGSLKAT